MKINPKQWLARREQQHSREANAEWRLDEARTILRHGDAESRAEYIAAAAAWHLSGEPDVPFITKWFDSVEAERDELEAE